MGYVDRIAYKLEHIVITLTSVVHHWTIIEDAEGSPLTLIDGTTQTIAANLLAELMAATSEIQNPLNGAEMAASRLSAARAAVLRGAVDYRAAVKYLLKGTAFEGSLPKLESSTASTAKIRLMCASFSAHWQTVEQAQGPFVARGLTRMQFEARITELSNASKAVSAPRVDLRLARQRRIMVSKQAIELIKLYRQALPVLYGPDSPYVKSMPKLQKRSS